MRPEAPIFLLLLPPVLAAGETHSLRPPSVAPDYALRAPILTLRPGDVLTSETPWEEKRGGTGEVGPIRIEGAEPGDALVVAILKLRPSRETAISTLRVSEGAEWHLDARRMIATSARGLSVPLAPALGHMAVTPPLARAGSRLGAFGGDLDVADLREGVIVELPVFHKGALFYFGGGRVLQGDDGGGLATSMEVALRFDVRKGKQIRCPRLEDAEHLIVVGSGAAPEALRAATEELARWLVEDYGFETAEAHELLSQVATIRMGRGEVPPVVVLVEFPKSLLARPRGGEAGIRLSGIPWTEAEGILTADRIVLLPLGAGSKEHGPHLLLGNDEILADYLAHRVSAARPVAVLPTLTYGYYPSFLEYPGSVSLSFDSQRDIVAEICRSIAGYGPRRFYILNTGISTLRPLQATSEVLAKEGILMRFTDLHVAGSAAERGVREETYGTHADEIETSLILYMKPSAVRMDKAVADGRVERSGPLTRDPSRADGHYSPSGVWGDPTLATWQKGERVTEGLLGDILKEIDELGSSSLPPGKPRSPLGQP
jgi:creatinine amidohydrolase/Fe(II)-dependent formamide hydrolase-like protein/acetamidase/formamidase